MPSTPHSTHTHTHHTTPSHPTPPPPPTPSLVLSAKTAASDKGALLAKAQTLAAALEAEQAGRRELKERAQRKLAAAEAEVAKLRGEAEAKARQLQVRGPGAAGETGRAWSCAEASAERQCLPCGGR